MSGLLGLALGLLALVGLAVWVYARREPPVPGRALLAVLRISTLALLALLLWNPGLPRSGAEVGGAGPLVLLDGSLSMSARDTAGRSPWQVAVARARTAADEGATVLLFGDGVRPGASALSDSVPPGDASSLLAPALERAASLGAPSVRVLSDLRIEDPVAAARAARELDLPIRFEAVGGRVRNAGVGRVELPEAAGPGGSVRASVTIHGAGGGPGDSVDVVARLGERILARRRVRLPEAGRPVRTEIPLPVPGSDGRYPVRFDVEATDDAFQPDDRRLAVLEVDPERTGLLLISLRPDWEPRYLLPVLEQVSGLRARGYLALTEDRWLPMGRGGERRGAVAGDEVRERLSGVDVLVVHGLGSGAPGWVDRAVAEAAGALVFPTDPTGADRVGLEVADARGGEWYASPELPSSPLAGDLAAVALDDLPPLSSVFPLLEASEVRVPLRLRRARSGPAEAALALRTTGERRSAVALAEGFWRWGARDGDAREAYRRLWAGVTGWLLAAGADAAGAAVAAPEGPVPRGRPVTWRVRGLGGDSLRLRVLAGDTVVTDTALVPREGDPVRTPPPPGGSYRWEARAGALDGGVSRGELFVSDHSSELQRPVMDVSGIGRGEADGGEPDARGAARPLRTHPLPYVLLVLLLSVEWIGRRRQGLR